MNKSNLIEQETRNALNETRFHYVDHEGFLKSLNRATIETQELKFEYGLGNIWVPKQSTKLANRLKNREIEIIKTIELRQQREYRLCLPVAKNTYCQAGIITYFKGRIDTNRPESFMFEEMTFEALKDIDLGNGKKIKKNTVSSVQVTETENDEIKERKNWFSLTQRLFARNINEKKNELEQLLPTQWFLKQ